MRKFPFKIAKDSLHTMLLFTYALLACVNSFAQVGINTTSPNAILDIQSSNETTPSNNDGILIPRVDNFATVNPTANQNGMLVFATGNGTPTKGFYYWDHPNTTWVLITGTGGSGSGNTLDQAYDQNGAGLGKNIEATDGAVRINGEDGFLVVGSFGNGTTIDTEITGSGTRMFFNPNKAAFRAGGTYFSEWDDINIGDYSTAFSLYNIASGSMSTAFGFGTTASGFDATAFGFYTTASSDYSVAFGAGSSTGIGSVPYSNYSAGSAATAFGLASHASAVAATAFGDGGNATEIGATAFGHGSLASGYFSTAFGTANTASALNATAFGENNIAAGSMSTVFGQQNVASGVSSTAFGQDTAASGANATAFGFNTTASALSSTAFGQNAAATGYAATASGYETVAPSSFETVIGSYNTTYTPAVSSLGYSNQDRIFVIGNGFPAISGRSNALTIYKSGLMNINDEYDMPLTDGNANQVMTTNGAGVVSFQDANTLNGNTLDEAYDEGGFGAGRIINATNGPVEIHANGGLLVESANQTHMFFVDGVTDAIGINTAAPTATLSVNGTANKLGGGAWAVFSDARLKENVSTYSEGLALITKVRPVNFSYNDKMKTLLGENKSIDKRVYQGVIAQELQKIAPDMVKEVILKNPNTQDATNFNGKPAVSERFLEVDPNKFTYALINAVQEQQEIIKELITEIEQMENRLDVKQKEIEAIKKHLKI